jgi:hypothetical protein
MKVSEKRLILWFGYLIDMRVMVRGKICFERIKEAAGIKIIFQPRYECSIGNEQQIRTKNGDGYKNIMSDGDSDYIRV